VGTVHSILYYNYMREFAEEFFSLDQVIYSATARYASSDSMFQLPQIAALEKRVPNRQFTLVCTVIAVNPQDGSINIAMLASSRSRSFLAELRSVAGPNPQAAQGGARGPSIEFLDPYDAELDRLAEAGRINANSVFALGRRERLARTAS
jgi:hypothetical protein